jgi:Family of unknown function (DUF6157)
MHTTNYKNTFVTVAPDCAVNSGIIPGKPDSIAGRQYALLSDSPYRLTSDDLLFAVHAAKNGLPDTAETRVEFFSKPKACLRASPLPKQYGWGIHHDTDGRIALVAVGSAEYDRLLRDKSVKSTPAMRATRGK